MVKSHKNHQSDSWLPEMLPFDDMLREKAYKHFLSDFKQKEIWLEGKKVIINKNDSITFKHLITECQGTSREHSVSRCRRIPWIKVLIENANTDRVMYWIQNENGTRVHYITLPDFSYLVILKSNRTETVGLSTAFYVDIEARYRLIEQYDNYQERQKLQNNKKIPKQKNNRKFITCFSLKMQGYAEQEIAEIADIPLVEVLRLLKRKF